MDYINKVQIVSRKPLDEGFEYFIRMPNRRMVTLISDRDMIVGNEVYISYTYFGGEFFNICFL